MYKGDMIMSILVGICGYIIGSALSQLNIKLDNPYFWLIYICYVLPHSIWMIREHNRNK